MAGAGAASASGAKRANDRSSCAPIQSILVAAPEAGEERAARRAPQANADARRPRPDRRRTSRRGARRSASKRRPSAGRQADASPTSKPAARPLARSRAAAISASERSMPVTRAPGSASASARLVAPAPQPMSRIAGAWREQRQKRVASSASLSGASVRSVRRHSSAQASPTRPCHSNRRRSSPPPSAARRRLELARPRRLGQSGGPSFRA